MKFQPDVLLQAFVAFSVAALSYHTQLQTLWHWTPVAAAPFVATKNKTGALGSSLAVVFIVLIILASKPTVGTVSACAAAGLFAAKGAPCDTLGARSTRPGP